MKKILIADDHEISRNCLERVLTRRGYGVECAADGVQALEKARISRPDVIISDILMPEMDGFTLCRRVKEDGRLKNIPFIFYSATFCGEEDKKLALSLGADACVVKPAETEDFLKVILRALEESGKRAPAAGRSAPVPADELDRRYQQALLQKLQLKILELEASRRELARSEERYSRITSVLTDYVYVVAVLEGRPAGTEHGDGVVAVTGYTREDFAANPGLWLEMVAVEDREAVLSQSRRLLSGAAAPPVEHRLIRKDGAERWVRSTLVPYFDPDGGLVSYCGIIQDITERRTRELRQTVYMDILKRLNDIMRHEHAVKDILSLIRQSALVDAAGIRVKSGEDYPYYASEGFSEGFLAAENSLCARTASGEPARDASGSAVLECMCGGVVCGRMKSATPFYTEGGSFWSNCAADLLAASGRQAHARSRCVESGYESVALIPLRYGARNIGLLQLNDRRKNRFTPGMIEFFEGISVSIAIALDHKLSDAARAGLEAQLRQAQKMEAVGRLAGGVAHDFNNVLMTIMGYSDFLMKSLAAGDERRSDVEEIKKAADRAKALTGQLLVFSRKQKLNPQVVDLNRILRDTEKMLGRLIGEDIELVFRLDPELDPVLADPGQLEQIVMNLAINSRDAMPGGGKITIETRNVRMDETDSHGRGVMPAGRYAQLSFADTGAGMEAAVQEHLFEPFFTTKGEGKGTGLGLSTVYGIVKQFNGYIFAYSETGKGTVFRIYLPPAGTAAGSASEAAEPASEYLRGTETILVAEDETPVRAVTARLLRQNGYTALEAADGAEALKICAERAKDIRLALVDTIMPRMGGAELAARLKADHPHIRVVFTSGYTEDAVRSGDASGLGAAFIQKPMEHRALLKTIRRVLDFPPDKCGTGARGRGLERGNDKKL